MTVSPGASSPGTPPALRPVVALVGAVGSVVLAHSLYELGDAPFPAVWLIAGTRARRTRGLFFELKATGWDVANVRLLAGFNF